jgi:hypothetical protein
MKKSEAVSIFGGVRKLADALGITREAIYQWPEQVPRLRQYEIRDIMARREQEAAQQKTAQQKTAA